MDQLKLVFRNIAHVSNAAGFCKAHKYYYETLDDGRIGMRQVTWNLYYDNFSLQYIVNRYNLDDTLNAMQTALNNRDPSYLESSFDHSTTIARRDFWRQYVYEGKEFDAELEEELGRMIECFKRIKIDRSRR